MEMGSLPLIRMAWIIPGSPSSDRHWGMVTGRNIPPLFHSRADWRRAKRGEPAVCVCLCGCKHPRMFINEAVWLEWAPLWAQAITWIPPLIAYLYAHTCFSHAHVVHGGVETVKAHSSNRSKYIKPTTSWFCVMCAPTSIIKSNQASYVHIHTHSHCYTGIYSDSVLCTHHDTHKHTGLPTKHSFLSMCSN